MQQPTIISRWWTGGFVVAAFACFIAGGALLGVWYTHTSSCASNYIGNTNQTWDDYTNCATTKNGIYYGAIACFLAGVILKIIALSLMFFSCIQRSRYNQQIWAYQAAPPVDLNNHPYGPGQYSAPPYYPPQPGYQYPAGYPPQYPAQTAGYAPAPTYPGTAYQGHGGKDSIPQPSNGSQAPAHYA